MSRQTRHCDGYAKKQVASANSTQLLVFSSWFLVLGPDISLCCSGFQVSPHSHKPFSSRLPEQIFKLQNQEQAVRRRPCFFVAARHTAKHPCEHQDRYAPVAAGSRGTALALNE